MPEEEADFVEELLSDLISPGFADMTKAEQIAQAKNALHRLEAVLEERRSARDSFATEPRRRSAASDLPQLIGEVVIAAAWAEDAAGTLIQAASGSWEVRARGYDDTSSSLVRALRPRVPLALIDRLETALKLRHFVVHGFFVDANFLSVSGTDKTYDFVSMKRSWRTDAPERDVKAFTRNALGWLAQEFWEIEEELEQLHGNVLFGEESGNLGES